MTTKREVFSVDNISAIKNNRVFLTGYSPNPGAEIIRIQNTDVNAPVLMQERIHRNPGTSVKPIIFTNCIFNEPVDIGSFENSGNITFNECIFNKSVKIQYDNAKIASDCVFNGDLSIELSKFSEAEISDFDIKNKLEIYGSSRGLSLKNINKRNEKLNQEILIHGEFGNVLVDEVKTQSFEFSDATKITNKFIVSNIETNELCIGAIVLDTNAKFNNCDVRRFQIDSIKGEVSDLVISDSEIKEMKFKIGNVSNLSIVGGSINVLVLSGSNESKSILNIEKATITNLKFERLYNYGLITLRELATSLNGLVSFRSCNIGKADFIYCNFSKAILEFENSKITEAFFSETEFPKRVLVERKKNYGQEQLIFGQLATAFQKQGDNIRALEYNSRELEAHYRNIRWFSPAFFQKLNLWLNSISNNFGRNWFLGTVFSFGIGILFFCFLLVSTNNYQWGFPQFDFSLTPAYLKFMNPLRFFELEALFNNTHQEGNIKLNGLSYLADFGGRLFIAYGYYQTIQAFRRFGRK